MRERSADRSDLRGYAMRCDTVVIHDEAIGVSGHGRRERKEEEGGRSERSWKPKRGKCFNRVDASSGTQGSGRDARPRITGLNLNDATLRELDIETIPIHRAGISHIIRRSTSHCKLYLSPEHSWPLTND